MTRRIYEGSAWANKHDYIVRVVAKTSVAVAYQWVTGPSNGQHMNCSMDDFVRKFRLQKMDEAFLERCSRARKPR